MYEQPQVVECDIVELAAAHPGAVVVDVREPEEYVAGHVPGALLIPLARLAATLDAIPPADLDYVICASGNRSKVGAAVLNRAGRDARSVAGGTKAWAEGGNPLETGGPRA